MWLLFFNMFVGRLPSVGQNKMNVVSVNFLVFLSPLRVARSYLYKRWGYTEITDKEPSKAFMQSIRYTTKQNNLYQHFFSVCLCMNMSILFLCLMWIFMHECLRWGIYACIPTYIHKCYTYMAHMHTYMRIHTLREHKHIHYKHSHTYQQHTHTHKHTGSRALQQRRHIRWLLGGFRHQNPSKQRLLVPHKWAKRSKQSARTLSVLGHSARVA
jgi:hypothetical protein